MGLLQVLLSLGGPSRIHVILPLHRIWHLIISWKDGFCGFVQTFNFSPLTQFPGGEIPVRTKVQIIPVLNEYLLVLLDDVDAGQAGDHAPPRVVKHHELCVWNEAVVGLVSQRGAIVL